MAQFQWGAVYGNDYAPVKKILNASAWLLEVHDAVYSLKDVPVEEVEKAIRKGTGFDIVIDKEGPEEKAVCNPFREYDEHCAEEYGHGDGCFTFQHP